METVTTAKKASSEELCSPHDMGILKIKQLKRLWHANRLQKKGLFPQEIGKKEDKINRMLLDTLHLSKTLCDEYLALFDPTFDQFENWILMSVGWPDETMLMEFNRLFDHIKVESPILENVLLPQEVDFFSRHGYLILKNVVSGKDCLETKSVISDLLEIGMQDDGDCSGTSQVYRSTIQYCQHHILQRNCSSPLIKKVFQQLLQTSDIWLRPHQIGFFPAEVVQWQWNGNNLKCLSQLKQTTGLRLKGLLCFNDITLDHGHFILKPKSQYHMVSSGKKSSSDLTGDLHKLTCANGSYISASAGDLIIFDQNLPYGINIHAKLLPCYVQYVTYEPFDDVYLPS